MTTMNLHNIVLHRAGAFCYQIILSKQIEQNTKQICHKQHSISSIYSI